jgi:hypothetical protein
MFEAIGIVMIAVGVGGLAIVGLYAMASGLNPTVAVRPKTPRIDERLLLQASSPVPPHSAHRQKGWRLDGQLADEIFSELFSLRADVAELANEVRALARHMDATRFADKQVVPLDHARRRRAA